MNIGNLQVDIARERFIMLNCERLNRTKELLRPKQRDLIDLLPLLFHVNQTALPGFVSHETPFGVSSYALDESIINVAKRTWKGFDFQSRAQWAYAVEAIFLMGSVGTIAFSSQSDIDVWLCVKPTLTPEQLALIQKKATAIEKWYEEQDMEVHFFLMNVDEFRSGKSGELSTENSGSAQHKLLLDEFYRTSIWVAGKHPVWWFVPPGEEASYDEIKKYITDNKLVDHDECVDFGALPTIPVEEFFGAAVWQLYKAVDSPYKSILKILLMETYAATYPNIQPLASQLKKRVYEGDVDLDKNDPYVVLLDCLEQYLGNRENIFRREVVRRSFYIKIGIALSSGAAKDKNDWRHNLLRKIVHGWGWQEKHLLRQDGRSEWKIDEIMDERKLLIDALSKSYLFLSNFAKKNSNNPLIKQRELTILGRKLYSVFEKKPNKIELLTHGIGSNVSEDRVTILLARTKNNEERWLLFRGKVTGNDIKTTLPIRSATGLVELLAWAYFNQVIGSNTQKLLYAPGCDLTNQELNVLLDQLKSICPNPEKFKSTTDDLVKPIYAEATASFLNVGKVAKTVSAQLDKGIIAGSVDIIKYGTSKDSFFSIIEMIFVNSWKEVFVNKYDSIDGLMEWLKDYLLFGLNKDGERSRFVFNEPNIFSFSSHYGHTIVRRLKKLIDDARRFFFDQTFLNQSYLIEAARNFYVLEKKSGKMALLKYDKLPLLLSYFAQPSKSFRSIAADTQAISNMPLREIFMHNKPDAVQVFYEPQEDFVTLYFMDENGALFIQKVVDTQVLSVLSHYYWFLRSKLSLQHFGKFDEGERDRRFEKQEDYLIEFYSIKKDGFQYVIKKQDIVAIRHSRKPFEVKAVGAFRDKKTLLSFQCGNKQVGRPDQGDSAFQEVADIVLQMRAKSAVYNLYITQLELDDELLKSLGAETPQTIFYLKYKKKIEDRLNTIMLEKTNSTRAQKK